MIYLVLPLIRTGSSWFCSTLADTGLVGHPAEWGNRNYCLQFGLDVPGCVPVTVEYLRRMRREYTVNGWFGMKIPVGAYRSWFERYQIEGLFPEKPLYVYLRREDHVKQAISAMRASETGKWFFNQNFPTGRPSVVTPQYARWKVDHFIREFEKDEAVPETYFRRMKIEPLRVTYEELCEDMRGSVLRVLEFLGVAVPEGFVLPESRMIKQADGTSAEWEARYRRGE